MSGLGPLRPASGFTNLSVLRNHSPYENPHLRHLDLERVTRAHATHHLLPQPQDSSHPLQWPQDPWSERHKRQPSIPYNDLRPFGNNTYIDSSSSTQQTPLPVVPQPDPYALANRPRSVSTAPSRTRNQSILRRQVIAREPLVSQTFLQDLHRHAQEAVADHHSPSRLAATVTNVRDPRQQIVNQARQPSVSRWGTSVGNSIAVRESSQYVDPQPDPLPRPRDRAIWVEREAVVQDDSGAPYESGPYNSSARYSTNTFANHSGTSSWETVVPLNDDSAHIIKVKSQQMGVPYQYADHNSQALPPSRIGEHYHRSPAPAIASPPHRAQNPPLAPPLTQANTLQPWHPFPPRSRKQQPQLSQPLWNSPHPLSSSGTDWTRPPRAAVMAAHQPGPQITPIAAAVTASTSLANVFDIAVSSAPRVTAVSAVAISQRSSDNIPRAPAVNHTRVPTLQPRHQSPAPGSGCDSPLPLARGSDLSSRKRPDTSSQRPVRKVPREQLRQPPILESEGQSRDGPPMSRQARTRQEKQDRKSPSKSPAPVMSDEESACVTLPGTSGGHKLSDLPVAQKSRVPQSPHIRKGQEGKRVTRPNGARRSRQVRDSVTDEHRKDLPVPPSVLPAKDVPDGDAPVLAQIQTAVSELATICKSLTEARQSSRRSIEKQSKKPVDANLLSPRTLTELTEKVSRNVTHQVLDSLFHQLYPKDKSHPSISSSEEAIMSSEEEPVGRHRAFSWSDAVGQSAKRKLKQLVRARQETDMLKASTKDHISLPMPESHTVSSTSPGTNLSLYGRRPDVHTYGGQMVYPPWLLAPPMNPYLHPMPPMDPMHAMGYFGPYAQMYAASQSAVATLGGTPTNNTPAPASPVQTSALVPSRKSYTLVSPSSANDSPRAYPSSPMQLGDAESLEPTPIGKELRGNEQNRSPTSPSPTSIDTTVSPLRIAGSHGADSKSMSSFATHSPPRGSSNVYDGVEIQSLPYPAPERVMENLAPHPPPIRRVSSGTGRSPAKPSASLSQSPNVPRKAETSRQQDQTSPLPFQARQTPALHNEGGGNTLPQQEVLYTLRIDTFHGDNVEKRRESWAKTREVDVIQVYKDPEILVLPELVTSQEIALILKSADGLWANGPMPGEIVDEIMRTDAYGRVMTSNQQPSHDVPILIANLAPELSPCVGRVQRRLAASAQMEVADVESMQLLRYLPGSFLPPHVDGHHKKTAVIFLNDVGPGGGSIAFLKLGLQIQPQKGTGVLWSNTKNARGRSQLNGRSIHCDQPHPSHEKLVLLCLFKDKSPMA